jgi:Fe-S-cluster containining protein
MGIVLNTPRHTLPESLKDVIGSFPYAVDENGQCEKLTEDNKCSVYDKRPELCRVDVGYRHFKETMTKKQYIQASIATCKMLMGQVLKMSENEIKRVYEQMNDGTGL